MQHCARDLCGEGELTTYRFNTGTAQHTFCRRCGIHAFYVPRSDPDQISVNARCLDEIATSPRCSRAAFLTGAIGRRRLQRGRPPGHDSPRWLARYAGVSRRR